uniref:Serpentine receptor class gamma n=1 Tax=Caenorhabditis tropicalis TaxID=1561998 RepID=A0A1I7SZ14_9PELO
MKNLTKIAVFNSVLFFIVFIWQFFGSKVLGDWLFWASLFVLSDALSLSIPYILLAFDQNVRTTLAKVVLDKAERMAGNLAKQRSSQRVTSVVSVI